jgi:hypothetical protein
VPFKCNVHRYTPVLDPYVPGGAIANACVVVTGANRGIGLEFARQLLAKSAVGLCRLNQVDPYPITYSLSKP